MYDKRNMIILLQNVTTEIQLFWHIPITKCDEAILSKVRQVLQSEANCFNKLRQVLQTATDFCRKCAKQKQSKNHQKRHELAQKRHELAQKSFKKEKIFKVLSTK